jgi:hypothetical protein
MISRLMINLRDPTLHRPADCDGTVTTSHAGYVSTVALEEIILTPTAIGCTSWDAVGSSEGPPRKGDDGTNAENRPREKHPQLQA